MATAIGGSAEMIPLGPPETPLIGSCRHGYVSRTSHMPHFGSVMGLGSIRGVKASA